MANATGPIPKRSEDRTRRNKENEAGLGLTKGLARGVKKIPFAQGHWDKRTKEFYKSLKTSGMEAFYEDSDWQYAQVICEMLDRCLTKDRVSVGAWTEVLNGMASLGVTEAERRRMRIELADPPSETDTPAERARKRIKEQMNGGPTSNVVSMFGDTA